MTRILLTGITGQVGQELQQTLASLGEVVSVGRDRVDFSQPDAVQQVMETVKPAIVVNSAAYTAVDKAESEPDLAKLVNAVSPGVLAKAASRINAGLIHISTDYVFDGTHSSPYLETAATNPLGVYGSTKLAGEAAVRAECDRHLIIRTAWVYGAKGKGNFVKTMLRLGAEREELRVVADQIGAPTWSKDLAAAIAQLAPQLSADTAGTYHYTNSGVCSWYDFAIAIFEEAQQLGFPLKIQRVIPITTPEYPTPAKRPPFSVLSLSKISTLLGTYPPYWRQSLRAMLSELKQSGS
ncbi:MAG: dTDP-4-dehydrorhamnose reductase [Stenomitos frigidus ULC029]